MLEKSGPDTQLKDQSENIIFHYDSSNDRETPAAKISSKELTTNEAELRAGTVVMDIYKTLDDETIQKIIGETKENELPVVGVDHQGMVLFPETGTLVLPSNATSEEIERILKTPVSYLVDTERGNWVFAQIQKPEKRNTETVFDPEDDENLSIRKISEKAPLQNRALSKKNAQVMRVLSGALSKDVTVKDLELTQEDGTKIKVAVEKNEKGKTVLIDAQGNKRKLAEFPQDIENLYETYFKGPASGEEELGIEAAFPKDGSYNLPKSLETKIGQFPEVEKQVNFNTQQRTHSLYMELTGPIKALNQTFQKEKKKIALPESYPRSLPEDMSKLGIRPLIIGVGGKVTVFYDGYKDDLLVCEKQAQNTWTAHREPISFESTLKKATREKVGQIWE